MVTDLRGLNVYPLALTDGDSGAHSLNAKDDPFLTSPHPCLL